MAPSQPVLHPGRAPLAPWDASTTPAVMVARAVVPLLGVVLLLTGGWLSSRTPGPRGSRTAVVLLTVGAVAVLAGLIALSSTD